MTQNYKSVGIARTKISKTSEYLGKANNFPNQEVSAVIITEIPTPGPSSFESRPVWAHLLEP